jgi:exodeoxyribonuclease V gamma subunit
VSLTLHRAERSDILLDRLADVLASVPADPFAPDLVAVPSKGVERWIAQSLSSRLGAKAADQTDGVCANVLFPSPGRLVREALARASEIEPDVDPWNGRRLPWPLIEVIDGCATEPWCRTLGRHLGVVGTEGEHGRRMAVAQKLAGLYTAYGAERPTMLQAWRSGQDTDGYGGRLDPDLAWQAELWRRLRDHVGVPSPAERIQPACDRLRDQPDLLDLPDRLSIFGPTRLTTAQLAVIDALAQHRDLRVWLPHPSDGLWRHVATPADMDDATATTSQDDNAIPARTDDSTAERPDHALLRSLGRDARELQLRLRAHTSLRDDQHLAAPATPDTLLGALQRDLHADRAPDARHELTATDRSIQVHACHGRHRQVEVLREVLLGLLADDPTLELRDIIVMCPDIETYAPLVSANFGTDLLDDDVGDSDGSRDPFGLRHQAHPGHQLTFRLADRSLRQTNPVLEVAARLLELVDSRLTASEVLDLVAMPPVRRRFRLDDDALERLGDWVRRSGVRWGLDAGRRAAYGLDGISQNTWQHGLDRILAGVLMDDEDLGTVGPALPLDDVDSTEIDLAGRLAELVDRLDSAMGSLDDELTLDGWVGTLDAAVDSLVDVAPTDAWQVTQAKATLAGAVTAASDGRAGTTLRLSDVRALLGDRLEGRPTRANFRTGHLTICTMVPMRSVPHRVVCLLGLDDGVFPRGARVDGDDILARRPRVGERDRRSEDRQLFLDAILAAQERLVILYTGADERTGAERPPAVPLSELLDVLDRTATAAETRVRDHVLVRHPLQPFDARNFESQRLGRADAFSFDQASYAGSLALRKGQATATPFLPDPLPEQAKADSTADVVELDQLIRFLEHPVRGFLQQRLDLRTADEHETPSDAIPVAPGPLDTWAVGDRLLRSRLRGRADAAAAAPVELMRGELPPGRLGQSALEPVADNVRAILDRCAGLLASTGETIDVSVSLPSGCTVAGTVPHVYGDRPVRIEYSRLSAKHRLRAWVQLLALTAWDPDRDWWTATVGRGSSNKERVVGSFLRDVEPDDARRHLDDLVTIHRIGLTRPLPAPPKTCCAYASRRGNGAAPSNALTLAGKEWSRKSSTGEMWGEYDADHDRAGLVTFADLVAATPDAVPLANPTGEPHLFGLLATTIWTPLLQHEELTT